jgi:hypothetical protein
MEDKMKNKVFLAGIFGFMLVFGVVLTGCDNGTTSNGNTGNNGGGGLSGNWGGTVKGQYVSVSITSNGWSLETAGFSDYGTYSMDGITARLRSSQYNVETGIAVLLDSNTISVTLNSNSIAPGATYRLTRE